MSCLEAEIFIFKDIQQQRAVFSVIKHQVKKIGVGVYYETNAGS